MAEDSTPQPQLRFSAAARERLLREFRANVAFVDATQGSQSDEEEGRWPFADCMPPLERVHPSSVRAAQRAIRSKLRRMDVLHGAVVEAGEAGLRVRPESAAEPDLSGEPAFDIDLREIPLLVSCPAVNCGQIPPHFVPVGSKVTGVVTALDEASRTVHISLDPWKVDGVPSPPRAPLGRDPAQLSSADATHLCTAIASAVARRCSGAHLGVWPPEGAGGALWGAVRARDLRPTTPPPPPPPGTSMAPAALADDTGFLNPGGIAAMLRAYGVGGALSAVHSLTHAPAEGYREVRRHQNRLWCTERVARGVEHARAGRAKEALSAYDRAVELDPSFADAYVARGALMATKSKYSAAVAQFEKALRIDPGHDNALSYLERTEAKMGVPVGQRRAEQLRRRRERGEGGDDTAASPAEAGPTPKDPTPADASAGSVSLHGDERSGSLRLKFGEGVGIVPPAALAPASSAHAPADHRHGQTGAAEAPPAAHHTGATVGEGGPSVSSMSRSQLLALIRSRQSASRSRGARGNGAGPVGAANPALDTLVLEGGEEGHGPAAAAPSGGGGGGEASGERKRSRSARRHRKREKRERKEKKKRKKRGRKRRRSSRGSSSSDDNGSDGGGTDGSGE